MSKSILSLDESASPRQVLNVALSIAGYEVIEACEGVNALSKLDGRHVHLVISDVNMPNMDGIELVRQFKSEPDCKFTPTIMLTTESQSEKEAGAGAAGARARGASPSGRCGFWPRWQSSCPPEHPIRTPGAKPPWKC